MVWELHGVVFYHRMREHVYGLKVKTRIEELIQNLLFYLEGAGPAAARANFSGSGPAGGRFRRFTTHGGTEMKMTMCDSMLKWAAHASAAAMLACARRRSRAGQGADPHRRTGANHRSARDAGRGDDQRHEDVLGTEQVHRGRAKDRPGHRRHQLQSGSGADAGAQADSPGEGPFPDRAALRSRRARPSPRSAARPASR